MSNRAEMPAVDFGPPTDQSAGGDDQIVANRAGKILTELLNEPGRKIGDTIPWGRVAEPGTLFSLLVDQHGRFWRMEGNMLRLVSTPVITYTGEPWQ